MALAIRKPRDFGAGVLFVAIGALAIYVARSYDLGSARSMGPGYFPTALSIILMGLGILLLVRSLFGSGPALEPGGLRPLFVVLGAGLIFALLLMPAGMLVAIVAMVAAASTAERGFRLPQALALGAALALISWIVFSRLLAQQLPTLGTWMGG